MNKWLLQRIPVFTIAMMAMSNVAALFPAEVPVAPHVTAPVILSRKDASDLLVVPAFPEYPPVAKFNYIQGKVLLQVLVSRDGKVTTAHVLKGNPILAASALKSVRKWIYRPFQTASGPSQFLTNIEVKFSLQYQKTADVPPHPEEDLSQQIRVPEMIGKPDTCPLPSSVRLRVLVNEEGRAVDSELVAGGAAAFLEARDLVEGWEFRPARWGTLAVSWYLEVDVPGGNAPLYSADPEVGSR